MDQKLLTHIEEKPLQDNESVFENLTSNNKNYIAEEHITVYKYYTICQLLNPYKAMNRKKTRE